jgi:putative transposase
METVALFGPRLGVSHLCLALALPRATFYRQLSPRRVLRPRPQSRRALPVAERRKVLDVLHEPEFADMAPAAVYSRLLDQGRYLCSPRTMYRILDENQEVRERRLQLRHPAYTKPELLATAPNQVWSWDITKLLGPQKWTYFNLYVVMDIYSRCVVGWMLAHRERAQLAKKLIADSCERHNINKGELTVHADRGPSMSSKTVALLLADLGATKSHSWPHQSSDNPFSEAHFKTLKYRPDFPERFGCIEDARAHCRRFFDWYNNEHRHGGIAMLTPNDVHSGLAQQRLAERQQVLCAAYAAHPERFPRGLPSAGRLPDAVWINPPKTPSESQNSTP